LQCLAKAVQEAHRLKELNLFASVNIEPWMLSDLDRLIGEPSGIMLELTERDQMERPDISGLFARTPERPCQWRASKNISGVLPVFDTGGPDSRHHRHARPRYASRRRGSRN
jgi:hypothetical protein